MTPGVWPRMVRPPLTVSLSEPDANHEGHVSRTPVREAVRNGGGESRPGAQLDVTDGGAQPRGTAAQSPRQAKLSQVAHRLLSRMRLVQPPASTAPPPLIGLTARLKLPRSVGRGERFEARKVSTDRAVRPTPAFGLTKLFLPQRMRSCGSGCAAKCMDEPLER